MKYIFVLLFLFAFSYFSFAENGKTIHVVSHNKTMVITDPSKGINPYKHWSVFPSKRTSYRKAMLYVTYQCPESLHCGEWDYIDNIYLRRIGGSKSSSKDIEVARLISPYGWRFTPSWKFTWKIDVTDFAFLLHDSVEVEFSHSGYETSTDRGWLVTVDFALTKGTPAMECLGIQPLWQGSFPYGDSAHSIADSLHPISFTNTFGANIARMRILQTGHGMDDSENSAEFCSKYRRVLFDDSLIDQKQIWRECGNNPLYPQAGTWIYNRADWCPGSMVYPDVYDMPITKKSTHSVHIEMEPYIDRSKPTASYYFSSYLLFEKNPRAKNDISLEEIIAPSSDDDYNRFNPICSSPRILIKNSGNEMLTSVLITYGIAGEKKQTYEWHGRLASQRSEEVALPGIVSATEGKHQFKVDLTLPNGKKDEYPSDNSLTSVALIPPTYATQFILAFRTNHDSSNNAYQLKDYEGNVLRERTIGSLQANTLYLDTMKLTPGCYQLMVIDTAGDGLDFWANPDGGYGYVRLLDMQGHLVKSFTSDFGTQINHWFTVSENPPAVVLTDTLPLVNPFPIRNPGIFSLEIFNNEPDSVDIIIQKADTNDIVFHQQYADIKESFLPIDISSQPDGFYYVKVTVQGVTATRKIRIRHKN